MHFATHFQPNPSRSEYSRLLLGDGSTVNLSQLLKLDLSRLDLLVLSACNSGIIDSSSIDQDTFSVDTMIMARGVKAVVSTLWPVDNEATRVFMVNFYRLLVAGFDKDEALVRTQQGFISGEVGDGKWRQPYFGQHLSYLETG